MRRLSKTEANLSDAPVNGRHVLRKTLPYLWPAEPAWVRWRVVAALLAILLARGIAVATPPIYKAAVDALAEAGQPPLMLGAVGLTVAYGLARVMTVLFQQLRATVFARVGQRALRHLATDTFAHMHRLSLRYHISRKTGALSRVIERGVKGVDYLLRIVLFNLLPLIIEVALVAGILAVVFDLGYLLVMVATIVSYVGFTFVMTEWRVKLRKQMNDQDMDANQKAIDSLLNFETVKYFNAERREAARYDSAMRGYEQASLRTTWSLGLLNGGQSVIVTAGLVAVMVMAARGVQAGQLTVGDFVMVNAYLLQIAMPLNMLGTVYREIRQALIDMGDMFTLLDTPAEVSDAPGAPNLQVKGAHIRFDNVQFAYEPDRPILRGLSFEIAPGQSVAVVGPSGSGKSTLARLLFRFYDLQGGAITIDGQDIRDVTQHSLHDSIGVVPQDTVLFNDTIGYNIGYARADATPAQIESAARAAQVHDFIDALPQRYDTRVGERGLKLSGGEKQRVGIARTVLKDPPILILDEATSALDTQTEREIQSELRSMARGRSVLTIAHRLSTIAEADLILVLEAGQIVERGTHETLLAQNGRYAGLWAQQGAEDG